MKSRTRARCLVAAIVLAAQNARSQIPPALVGEWMLNEGAGQISTDNSGNGNNMILGASAAIEPTDPAWINAAGPTCGQPGLNFNGTVSLTTLTDNGSLSGLSAFTVDFCIDPSGYGGGASGRVISKESAAGDDDLTIMTSGANNNLAVEVYNTAGVGFVSLSAAGSLPLNSRTCWRAAYDAAGDRKIHLFTAAGGVYAETAYLRQDTANGTIKATANAWHAGNRAATDRGFAGSIDYLRVYNYAAATPPTPVAITVDPPIASPQAGGTQQFSVTVTGTANTAVNWTLDAAGAITGSITSQGLYTAPATVPSPATIKITATSVADVTKSTAAFLTIITPSAVSLSVSPTNASVQAGTAKKFKATVTGTANTGVTWLVNGLTGGNSIVGNIAADGLYTAPRIVPNPAAITIVAVSAANVNKAFGASLTITAPPTPATLDNLRAFPNPVNFGVSVRGTVKFTGLTASSTIRVYTTIGELVKTIPPGVNSGGTVNDGTGGSAEWNGRNENGVSVARGTYVYLITDPAGGKRKGLIAVTK